MAQSSPYPIECQAPDRRLQKSEQVTVGGTIPLPATPLLVLAGLAAMRAARRKRAHVAV